MSLVLGPLLVGVLVADDVAMHATPPLWELAWVGGVGPGLRDAVGG
jgi:hypothetical protein